MEAGLYLLRFSISGEGSGSTDSKGTKAISPKLLLLNSGLYNWKSLIKFERKKKQTGSKFGTKFGDSHKELNDNWTKC